MHCGWGEACPPTLVNAGSGALRTAGGGSEPLSCEAGRSRTACAPLARVRLSARAAGPGRGAKRGLGVRVRLFAKRRTLTRRCAPPSPAARERGRRQQIQGFQLLHQRLLPPLPPLPAEDRKRVL